MRRSFLLSRSPAHRHTVTTQALVILLASVLLTIASSVGATSTPAMVQPIEPLARFDRTTRHGLCHDRRCVVLNGTGRQLTSIGEWSTSAGSKMGRRSSNEVRTGESSIQQDASSWRGNYDHVEMHGNALIKAKVMLRGLPDAFTRTDFFNERGGLFGRFEEKGENDLLRSTSWAGRPAVEFYDKEERRSVGRGLL